MSEQKLIFGQTDRLLQQMYPAMEQDLLKLISYPSIQAEPDGENAPFGRAVSDALQAALEIAGRFGFSCRNLDGYFGIAEMPGASAGSIGVLSHVDVVPANAAQWTSPPFCGEVRDQRIYGRGALDDKGPLIASIYAAAALKQVLPHQLPKTVQLMFGCNEESGMECIKYYLGKFHPPDCGFSPDAAFPLIIGEKGIIHFSLSCTWDDAAATQTDSLRLISCHSGTAANIVPDRAEALLLNTGSLDIAGSPQIQIEQQGEYLRITATGKAAHASTPGEGDNALAALLGFLAKLNLAPAGAASYIRNLAELCQDSRHGSTMGLAAADELSRLTLVPSLLRIDKAGGSLACDIRFPVSHQSAGYQSQLRQIAADKGLQLELISVNEPMYAAEHHPVAATLLQVYRDFTGDLRPPLVIGGGTYAKELENFFAFGPEFADTPRVMHQADEFIRQRDLLLSAQIYARAIYCLAQQPS